MLIELKTNSVPKKMTFFNLTELFNFSLMSYFQLIFYLHNLFFIQAIVGEPNVGKSSLLNFLVQRPAAIVSSTAGTTRKDLIFFYQLELWAFY